MSDASTLAPGRPGIPPTWSSSAKDLVTTALGGASRLWVTLGHGILNEIFWPSTGEPQIRDLGFIVAGDDGWAEVKRVARYRVETPEPWLLLPTVVHEGEGYRLTLEVVPDPRRDAVLVSWRLEGAGKRLYLLLAPHLGGKGEGNDAWIDGPALVARHETAALCLLSEPPIRRAGAGYVGASDGWQDFSRHGRMTWTYGRAEGGNVALTAELPAAEGVLALGFADTPEGARVLAASSLAEGLGSVRERFTAGWRAWGGALKLPEPSPGVAKEAYLSAAVLKVHEDRSYPGAVVASLSVPWGSAHDDPGGYHLVWARDAVETGLALLAAGLVDDARAMLAYLVATQRPEGHWTQNFYPDGRPYWQGIQLDEVAFPILLAAKLEEAGAVNGLHGVDEMVRRAAGFIARMGPGSPQDRWEENAGTSPFTLAVEVAALVAAAEHLEGPERDTLLGLADWWNARIEGWTYVEGTELARAHDVPGYYVRIAPPEIAGGLRGRIEVKNRGGERLEASALVGLEFLYLVRVGLRAADDPRVRASLRVADAVLGVDMRCGRLFHRYDDDGYGEHEDGRPFDGSGVGRLWPLLAGERGHHDLALGKDPLPWLETMACSTGPGGLIPEQIWDADPIPARELVPGKPSGSAMPLVWAHAEFLKLLLARERGEPLERIGAVTARYAKPRPPAVAYWRDSAPFDRLPPGPALVVEAQEPFVLHFGLDGWGARADRPSKPLGHGLHGARLEAAELEGHAQLVFTRRFEGDRWEGTDHTLALGRAAG